VVADPSNPPDEIIFEIFGSRQNRTKIKFLKNENSKYLKAKNNSKSIEIEISKNDFENCSIPIRIINWPSEWINSWSILRLKGIEFNERTEIELTTLPHLEFGEIYRLEKMTLSVTVKKCKKVLNSGKITRDESAFLLPMTNMSSIRGWVNSDPAMIGKINKLRESKVLQLSEAALSEEMRLVKQKSLTLNSNSLQKSYQIEKEMIIYSTLIGAATENVELIGTAGRISRKEIKIENFQDYSILLYVDQPRNNLFFPEQNNLSVAENGQFVIELAAMEQLILFIDFFPILPNHLFDSVLDVTTKKGNIFKVRPTLGV